MNAPREFASRFVDVRAWDEAGKGGHFAAWECPQEYVDGIRRAVDLVTA